MIGIFDSGVGGICAYRELKRRLPLCDAIYLADRKNAPYGTKSQDEILKITKNNINLLKNCGAEVVLIACCTASSLHEMLDEEEKEISIPIIQPAAREATRLGGRIAVIATRHTAKSGAFAKEVEKISGGKISEGKISRNRLSEGGISSGGLLECKTTCGRIPSGEVIEFAEQELVSLVEMGNRDGRLTPECKEYLRGVAEKIKKCKAETLILGCTHFSHLEGEIQRLLPRVKIVSPAKVGVEELIRKTNPSRKENGRIVYM